MTSLKSRLALALLNKRSQRKGLSKGFTLVELMIVIVIVGVLSAVALPNFLSQTGKAKGTEAKSQISAIMKNAAAEYQQGGITSLNNLLGGVTTGADQDAKVCVNLGGPASYTEAAPTKTKFDYACTTATGGDAANDTMKVVATGNAADSTIDDKTVSQTIDLVTGTIADNRDETCTVFGGTKTADPCD